MITPFFSSFVEMNDDWNSLTVKDDENTFTVNIDGWSCSCKKEDCIHVRMAREYYESHLKMYEYNSEMAAMLYEDDEY